MSEPLKLSKDDVVQINGTTFSNTRMCTFLELQQGLVNCLRKADKSPDWVVGNIEGRVLKTTGGGWKKGKFRLHIEFVPDEPESPLDEMRAKLNQSQQSPPSDESQVGNE